jgi:ABC-type enterochelin transport system substrate-binding protein
MKKLTLIAACFVICLTACKKENFTVQNGQEEQVKLATIGSTTTSTAEADTTGNSSGGGSSLPKDPLFGDQYAH